MPKASDNPLESSVGWLVDRWLRLIEMIPGAAAAERALLGVLRDRLGELPANASTSDGAAAVPASMESPADVLERLLSDVDQTPEESRLAFIAGVLRRLTPDEVRILAALSDGTTFAVVHVGYGGRVGRLEKRVADNLSPIGRRAGVTGLELVPRYIAHLRELDLVETGPEDPSLEIEYEMLETDGAVRGPVARIEQAGERPRILRRTLRISAFGRSVWDACSGSDRR